MDLCSDPAGYSYVLFQNISGQMATCFPLFLAESYSFLDFLLKTIYICSLGPRAEIGLEVSDCWEVLVECWINKTELIVRELFFALRNLFQKDWNLICRLFLGSRSAAGPVDMLPLISGKHKVSAL